MKKNYFFTFLLTLIVTSFSFGQVTELYFSKYGEGSSNNKFLEIYNGTGSAIDLSAYSLSTCSNGCNNANEFDFPDNITFETGTMLESGKVYVIAHPSADATILAKADQTFTYLSNGDDAYALTLAGATANSYTIIDIIGDLEAEDVGSGWDVAGISAATANHTLTRKSSVCGPNPNQLGSFGTDAASSEWLVGDNDSGWDTIGSYVGCVTDPTLTIASPTNNQVFPSTSTTIPITLVLANFTLSGDNGSEMSDNTGDGYIYGTLTKNGVLDGSQNIFSDSVTQIDNAEPGTTYIITAELVDNSGNSLSPKVEQTVTFSVALPCDLTLGTIDTFCDNVTSGIDSYSGTIAFTGGNTGIDYTITAPDGVTIGGDNPETVAEGTITFSGMTEGVDTDITIVAGAGSSCDYSRTLYAPSCVGFPFIEHFDYTEGDKLGDQSSWTMLNSGDEMLIAAGNLDYDGLEASTGNKLTFSESGSETYTEFSEVTSGVVYASFLLKVTAFQTGTSVDVTDGGYIAALAGSTSGYDARLWVRPNPDATNSTFDIGFGVETSSPTFTQDTYNLNDVVFVVMAYDLDNSTVSTWINPASSSFESTIPTATISGADTNAPSNIDLFILRQDSNNETPFIEIDALRISDSWADVTPKSATASITKNQIEGFATYPNPVKNSRFTITTNSTDKKEVAIYNVLGKQVLTTNFSAAKSTIDVSSIASGLYVLKVTEGTKTATSKLVIK